MAKQTGKSTRLMARTQAQLAQALNVHVRSVRDYLGEGMPAKEEGGFDVGKCFEWYLQEKTQSGVNERKKLAEAIDREKAAELKDLDIQRRRGLVIDIDVATRQVSRVYGWLKRQLLEFGPSVAPVIPDGLRDQVMAEWDNKVRVLLHTMAAAEAVRLGDDSE